MLNMTNITKSFFGVKALDKVNLSVQKGQIHAVVGENGAGKSTLMKILSGVYPAGEYEGEIVLDGKRVSFKSIKDAENAGITIIYQELMLFPELTISENICLPTVGMFISRDKMYQDSVKWMQRVGMDDNPELLVKQMGVGKQQLVEIAKALSLNSRLLILDEPTAALTDTEIEKLFDVLHSLKAKGVTCIYISHKLGEVLEISDEITVLRDGHTVGSMAAKNTNESEIIQLMVGRSMSQRFPEKAPRRQEKVALELKNFNIAHFDIPGKFISKDIDLKLHYGEIVGLAGLMGAGRTELVNSLFGDFKGVITGEIYIDGQKVKIRSPADSIKYGIGLVTEDRKKNGLNIIAPVDQNVSMASLDKYCTAGYMRDNELALAVQEMSSKTKIKAMSIKQLVMSLSGGNQQKVAVAKWLMCRPKIMIFDEPTRGIDVGAKYEIYCLLQELKAEGVAILMISSELPEILGLSDRVLVIKEGKITAEFSETEATPEKIMEKAI
jgi:D-xylose transport system ATP-binding protein